MAEVVLELDATLLDDLATAADRWGFEDQGAYIEWVLDHHDELDPGAADPEADLEQGSEPTLEPDAEPAADVPDDTTGADDDDVARALEEIEDELDDE